VRQLRRQSGLNGFFRVNVFFFCHERPPGASDASPASPDCFPLSQI
jgi:hypothetical protein